MTLNRPSTQRILYLWRDCCQPHLLQTRRAIRIYMAAILACHFTIRSRGNGLASRDRISCDYALFDIVHMTHLLDWAFCDTYTYNAHCELSHLNRDKTWNLVVYPPNFAFRSFMEKTFKIRTFVVAFVTLCMVRSMPLPTLALWTSSALLRLLPLVYVYALLYFLLSPSLHLLLHSMPPLPLNIAFYWRYTLWFLRRALPDVVAHGSHCFLYSSLCSLLP